MIKVYVSHSRSFDFKTKLYLPLKQSSLPSQCTFIFPHENEVFIPSKEIIMEADLVIAEVSIPSLGVGIELGWANSFSVPVLCVYEHGFKLSKSLSAVTSNYVEYSNSADLIQKIKLFLIDMPAQYSAKSK